MRLCARGAKVQARSRRSTIRKKLASGFASSLHSVLTTDRFIPSQTRGRIFALSRLVRFDGFCFSSSRVCSDGSCLHR